VLADPFGQAVGTPTCCRSRRSGRNGLYDRDQRNPKQGYSTADIDLISSSDCGKTWQGPAPVTQGISTPTYKNTTFREGIVDTFAVGSHEIGAHTHIYPLYVAWEDRLGGRLETSG